MYSMYAYLDTQCMHAYLHAEFVTAFLFDTQRLVKKLVHVNDTVAIGIKPLTKALRMALTHVRSHLWK